MIGVLRRALSRRGRWIWIPDDLDEQIDELAADKSIPRHIEWWPTVRPDFTAPLLRTYTAVIVRECVPLADGRCIDRRATYRHITDGDLNDAPIDGPVACNLAILSTSVRPRAVGRIVSLERHGADIHALVSLDERYVPAKIRWAVAATFGSMQWDWQPSGLSALATHAVLIGAALVPADEAPWPESVLAEVTA